MIERSIHSAVITGPTGAVGTTLCSTLLSQGLEIYAVVRPESSRVSAIPASPLMHIIPCDVSQLHLLPSLIQNPVDAFFHLAWAHTIGPGRNDMPAQIENIRYAVDAADVAAQLGCKVFLGAGSQAEYGRVEGVLRPDTPCFPENGYGMAKLCAGEMTRTECEKLGIDHIWLRLLSVYGPHDGPSTMITTVIRTLLKGERPKLTAGEQMWDYLYSEDVARAFYLAALHGKSKNVYPVGSGSVRPLREYVELLRDAIDPKLPLGFGDIPYAPGQVMYLQADLETLQADTGFEAKTSFDFGIRKTIQWLRENELK